MLAAAVNELAVPWWQRLAAQLPGVLPDAYLYVVDRLTHGRQYRLEPCQLLYRGLPDHAVQSREMCGKFRRGRVKGLPMVGLQLCTFASHKLGYGIQMDGQFVDDAATS